MRELWTFISYLGLEKDNKNPEHKTDILCNQLNVLIFGIMLALFILLRTINYIEGITPGIGSLRILWVIILCLVNLSLSYFKLNFLSRIFLIILSPILFLLLPTFFNFVEEESFFYYPFTLIALSLLPQMLFNPIKERLLYFFGLIYYFILVIFIDDILIYFTINTLEIINIITKFLLFYKTSSIMIFLFINISVYYLRKMNINFEDKLYKKNVLLDHKNEMLNKSMKDLKLAHDKLVESEKMAALGTLTAGIVHEINNPLNYIYGGLSMLEDLATNETIKSDSAIIEQLNYSIEMVRTGTERSANIVKSLKTFSYKGKPILTLTNINELIDNTLLFLKSKLQSIYIYREYHLDKLVPVYQDKIHQVCLNIIDNAVFALNSNSNGKPKEIRILTNIDKIGNDEFLLISFQNNGPKIPDNIIKKVFDPFFTTKEPGKGTGLGLSISYSLIQEHNGSIEALNKEDYVVFRITIPVNNNL